MLAERAFGRLWAHRLDRIANTFDIVFQPVAHDREIRRQCTVVIDEENISEAFRGVTPDVLSDDLAADRAPNVVHSVLLAYFCCVVQRYGTVAVCDDEDVFLRKDSLCGHERRADDVGGFVLLEVSMRLVCE